MSVFDSECCFFCIVLKHENLAWSLGLSTDANPSAFLSRVVNDLQNLIGIRLNKHEASRFDQLAPFLSLLETVDLTVFCHFFSVFNSILLDEGFRSENTSYIKIAHQAKNFAAEVSI